MIGEKFGPVCNGSCKYTHVLYMSRALRALGPGRGLLLRSGDECVTKWRVCWSGHLHRKASFGPNHSRPPHPHGDSMRILINFHFVNQKILTSTKRIHCCVVNVYIYFLVIMLISHETANESAKRKFAICMYIKLIYYCTFSVHRTMWW